MYWTMLHTPDSTGTILSPDKYMMDNPEVQTFSHVGNKNGTGSINFENNQGRILASIEMTRHQDGLWYTTNPVLMPPTTPLERPTITKTVTTPLERPTIMKTATKRPTTTQTATAHQIQLETIDKTKTADTTKPINTIPPNIVDEPTVKLTKSLEQLELWHQRMGHPSSRVLSQTQRVVEGIPPLPDNNPLFKCPFCNMAKLRKANRHKESL